MMLKMERMKFIVGPIMMLVVVYQTTEAAVLNNRPVIGLVAQKPHAELLKYGNEYVYADYVKYLEMAGASVVVVKGNQPEVYYLKLFKSINGVLFPGGGVNLITSPYARTNRILFALAIEANKKGDYFPIWGTCLGFEMLTVLAAKKNILQNTDSENLPLPLTLMPTYKTSRLLGKAPKEIIHYLTHENVTANFHKKCLATETFRQYKSLNTFFRLISVNKGRQGKEYVSTMEAFNYPFYGTQWHPEKNIFTRMVRENISHTCHAVKVSQYMANFFVNEARKNFHKFASEDERTRVVVENDQRVFIPTDYFEGYFYNVTDALAKF